MLFTQLTTNVISPFSNLLTEMACYLEKQCSIPKPSNANNANLLILQKTEKPLF